MRRILAQAGKELIQLLRDKRALALALALPLTQLITMGSAISLDVKNLPLAIQDFDNSPASRQLIEAFRESISFKVVPFPVDQRPDEAFITNDARAVLIIPERFRARRKDAGTGAGGRIRFQHSAADRRICLTDHSQVQPGKRGAGRPRTGKGRHSLLV
jgi:ABC-2 type transport system permease protein